MTLQLFQWFSLDSGELGSSMECSDYTNTGVLRFAQNDNSRKEAAVGYDNFKKGSGGGR
jgi:hypothetical protein